MTYFNQIKQKHVQNSDVTRNKISYLHCYFSLRIFKNVVVILCFSRVIFISSFATATFASHLSRKIM